MVGAQQKLNGSRDLTTPRGKNEMLSLSIVVST